MKRLSIVLLVLLLVQVPVLARAFEVPVYHQGDRQCYEVESRKGRVLSKCPGDYVMLNGVRYDHHKEGVFDKNKNGVDDTRLQYFKASGKLKVSRYERLSTGKAYVWGIRASENINDRSNVFTLTDSDGDGIVDKQTFNGKYTRPDYLE